MKIFNSSQIRDIDKYTIINEPIKSINLMERAATECAKWIFENYFKSSNFKIFVGPGNNGGDGMAVARLLLNEGYNVDVYVIEISKKRSDDCNINLHRLEKVEGVKMHYLKPEESDFPKIFENDIVIDAIFGSGLTRNLDGFVKNIVENINKSESEIISIDIPSGLFSENNAGNNKEAIIKANYTLSFEFPKLAFFFAENYDFVSEWKILPIGLHKEYSNSLKSNYYYVKGDYIKWRLGKRKKFSHKGSYGNLLLISGSYGKIGAAILASRACLKSGCGLLTTHVPKIGYEIMQTALPEAMISIDWSDIIFTNVPDIEKFSCIGVGPGIGTKQNTQKALLNLLDIVNNP
ncbi:MAG: NAD(P)H-hydrate epimerase, partial [Bacteroidota bacterium]|nr:NAD(P)H-hydrate epimerase [Bacteroidota bacterium]